MIEYFPNLLEPQVSNEGHGNLCLSALSRGTPYNLRNMDWNARIRKPSGLMGGGNFILFQFRILLSDEKKLLQDHDLSLFHGRICYEIF